MKIIGIDPGLSGAIAILENNNLKYIRYTIMSEEKKKRQLNMRFLWFVKRKYKQKRGSGSSC